MTGVVKLYDTHELPLIGWTPGKEVEKSLESALKAGCRFVCTDYNNQDEVEVGRVLSRWFRENSMKRKEVFVSAKLPLIGNHTRRVKHFMRKSLENLRLEYVDLYLMSSPVGLNYTNDDTCFPFKNNLIDLDRQTDVISTWQAMETLVDAGMAKSIGLCNFNERQLRIIVRISRVPPTVLQVEYHAFFQQRELQAFCNKYEIAIYSSFPAGYNGNFCPKTLPTNFRQADVWGPKLDPLIRKFAFRHNISSYEILITFLTQMNFGVVISGNEFNEIRNYSQLLHFKLKDDEFQAIAELDKGSKGRTFNFNNILIGFDTHPEYPFNDEFKKSFHYCQFSVHDVPRNWY